MMNPTRKTSLEIENGAYVVTWYDESKSKYYDLKDAIYEIEKDFSDYTPENERK